MKKELKAKAVELRKQGRSYSEILKVIPVAKSTLSLWLRDVELSSAQKRRLKELSNANRKRFSVNYGRPNQELSEEKKEERREASRRGGLRCQELHGHRLHKLNGTSWIVGGLVYRKDELPIKEKLEAVTRQTFNKEVIGRQVIDFASEEFLVEHTIDFTRGITEAISRLQEADDDRRKVLISRTNRLGPVRRARCEGLTLLDLDDFNKGIWI